MGSYQDRSGSWSGAVVAELEGSGELKPILVVSPVVGIRGYLLDRSWGWMFSNPLFPL